MLERTEKKITDIITIYHYFQNDNIQELCKRDLVHSKGNFISAKYEGVTEMRKSTAANRLQREN